MTQVASRVPAARRPARSASRTPSLPCPAPGGPWSRTCGRATCPRRSSTRPRSWSASCWATPSGTPRALADGTVRVHWQVKGGVVEMDVTDGGGRTTPKPVHPGTYATSGRGLRIVRSLAHEWGVLDEDRGRTVWVCLGGPVASSPSLTRRVCGHGQVRAPHQVRRPPVVDADVPVRAVGVSRAPAARASSTRPATGERVPAAEAPTGRPFEGLPGEGDWVALREVVPAATATLRLAPSARRRPAGDGDAGPGVTEALATVLPMAWPGAAPRRRRGVRRPADRRRLPATPAATSAPRCRRAVQAEPGHAGRPRPPLDARRPRLQDLLRPDAPLEVPCTTASTSGSRAARSSTAEVRDSLERANAAVDPDRSADRGRGRLLVPDR